MAIYGVGRYNFARCCGRSPHGERGLKHSLGVNSFPVLGRSPHGECGLKRREENYKTGKEASLTHTWGCSCLSAPGWCGLRVFPTPVGVDNGHG